MSSGEACVMDPRRCRACRFRDRGAATFHPFVKSRKYRSKNFRISWSRRGSRRCRHPCQGSNSRQSRRCCRNLFRVFTVIEWEFVLVLNVQCYSMHFAMATKKHHRCSITYALIFFVARRGFPPCIVRMRWFEKFEVAICAWTKVRLLHHRLLMLEPLDSDVKGRQVAHVLEIYQKNVS